MIDKSNTEIIIFPNSLSMRRYHQEIALRYGFCDKTNHLTFYDLLQIVTEEIHGFDGIMSSAQKKIIRYKIINNIRKKELDILPSLSVSSCSYVLKKIEYELSLLPYLSKDIIEWMQTYSKEHRLWQIAELYNFWNRECQRKKLVDQVETNKIILNFVKNNFSEIEYFKNIKKIIFQNVRWFNPFEEQFICSLQKHISVKVESTLPEAHAEECAIDLGQNISSQFQTRPWAGWVEDLSDSIILNDNEIMRYVGTDNIDFSYSSGPYGEIEDLARRIRWYLDQNYCFPHQVALVIPTISLIDDIVPHVFKRFKLPYYFQRGRPVLSSPSVKAFLSWISFPISKRRDDLIDLIRNRSLSYENREEKVSELLLKPPILKLSECDCIKNINNVSGYQILDEMNKWLLIPKDHFNSSAIVKLSLVLHQIGEQSMTLYQMIDLIIELLTNEYIKPEISQEDGICILNLNEAVGMEFDVVCYASLNQSIFPLPVTEDIILNNNERESLRAVLENKSNIIPKMALPTASIKLKQQHITFITSLGISKKKSVFSYIAFDSDGKEQSPSIYFRKLWSLAGWGGKNNPKLNIYDNWRINSTKDTFLLNHFEDQLQKNPYDRKPMPGESFFTFAPVELAVSEDEILQQVAHNYDNIENIYDLKLDENLIKRIEIEKERSSYSSSLDKKDNKSLYCGYLKSKKTINVIENKKFNKISVTALEELMHNRYLFLLKRVLDIWPSSREVDDFPDPILKGNIIHHLLNKIYTGLKDGSSGITLPKGWVIYDKDKWIFSRVVSDKLKSIPLLIMPLDKEVEIISYAKDIIKRYLKDICYGHPNIWIVENNKIKQSIISILKNDIHNNENFRCFPVEFEFEFGKSSSQIEFNICDLNILGKIDRIDLCFNFNTNELVEIQILDYKGSKKISKNRIKEGLDCQLMIYAFVIQKFLFREYNKPYLNKITRIGYIEYDKNEIYSYKSYKEGSQKSLLLKDHQEIIDEFLIRINESIKSFKKGDFSIYPYYEKFENHESLLRNKPSTIQ